MQEAQCVIYSVVHAALVIMKAPSRHEEEGTEATTAE